MSRTTGTTLIAHAAVHHLAVRARRAARMLTAHALGRSVPSPTDLNVAMIRAAAERLDVGCDMLPGGFLRLAYGEQVAYTARFSDFPFEPLVPAFVCGDKRMTSTILAGRGLPVPRFGSFRWSEYDAARALFREIPKPVVTKPTRGTAGGVGVTMDVRTPATLRSAFARALAWSDEVMVEEQFDGHNLRITILDGEVIGAVLRVPAHVVGDGERSVAQLVEEKNALWREGSVANRLMRPIQTGDDAKRVLSGQGLALASVPEPGATVRLREVCNADQGGEVHDVAGELHPDHVRIALAAAAATGPVLCGVDLIVRDVKAPGGAVINEVNTTPALYVVNEMVGGRPSPAAAERILRRLFGPQPLG